MTAPKLDLTSQLPRYVAELSEWLAIPSISADPAYAPQVREAAQWLGAHLTKLGATDVILHETKGHPIVTARVGNDASKPTILVYGHYDVQPPDPLDLWETPPFKADVREGKLYARGACDDKGQVFIHLKALEALQQQGDLPCNIKLLIEGEEECGSTRLEEFVAANTELLKCDACVISDTSMIASDIPSLTVGLRGLCYIEVSLTGPNRDLHSGQYGGAVDNPIHALSRIITQLHDDQGRVTIPGFYDAVQTHDATTRAQINAAPYSEQDYKNALGLRALKGEAGYTTVERTGIRPCLDVNGIWGGYTGQGAKTVLPSKAHAKISMRLVPNQDHKVATKQLMDHLQSLTPPTMTMTLEDLHGGPAALTPLSGKAYAAAQAAFRHVWGKDPLPTFDGGSIPIVSVLAKQLGVDVVLLGFGLHSDAIHSPNEHFVVDHLAKGAAAVVAFHHFFAQK
jgi:acetylornithine deacetylase/succinyl-diaminopimelate desuccinylase-like protein